MTLKQPTRFIALCLALGWFFDMMYWKNPLGINFTLMIAALVAGGLFFAYSEEHKPHIRALLLLIPIAFFSWMVFMRLEPLTTFLNIVATLLLLGLLAHTLLGGRWFAYGFVDYISGAFYVGVDAISRQLVVLSKREKKEEDPDQDSSRFHLAIGLLRGLLIAIPVLLIFTLLLAQADPVFEKAAEDFLEFFRIENLVEFVWRTVVVCVFAYFLSGIYLHAVRDEQDKDLVTDGKGWLPRFLGFTEASVVLGLVNLLFLSFVVIQFQYFFGGDDALADLGYTYSEYARRGFGELVTVAFFALLMYSALSAITKRSAGRQQWGFSAMGITLVALVGVMLVSSWQRLMLYEEAYGFTRLRTYTHVFIPWLGLLLLAVVIMELTNRQRYLTLAMLVAGMSFIVSLNILNVDAFIVARNLSRVDPKFVVSDGDRYQYEQADFAYLASLSEDALPVLAQAFIAAGQNGENREVITAAIACQGVFNDYQQYADEPFLGWHLSRVRAANLWAAWQERPDFEELFVPVYDDQTYKYLVTINGMQTNCWGYSD
jgi:hypothetical protein